MSDLTGLGSVAELGKSVIDRLWPNKSEQERAELQAAMLVVQGQLEVNKAEAGSSSVFVAGWRPAVGWACAAAFAWNWCGLPIAKFAADLLGYQISLSSADMSEMLPVLLGMLGLGTLRTFEKVRGAEGNR
jgi:hypothetical protein